MDPRACRRCRAGPLMLLRTHGPAREGPSPRRQPPSRPSSTPLVPSRRHRRRLPYASGYMSPKSANGMSPESANGMSPESANGMSLKSADGLLLACPRNLQMDCRRNPQLDRVPACPRNTRQTPDAQRMRLNARHEKFAPYAGASARVARGHPGGRLCAPARATRLRAPAPDARLRVLTPPTRTSRACVPYACARATRPASRVTRPTWRRRRHAWRRWCRHRRRRAWRLPRQGFGDSARCFQRQDASLQISQRNLRRWRVSRHAWCRVFSQPSAGFEDRSCGLRTCAARGVFRAHNGPQCRQCEGFVLWRRERRLRESLTARPLIHALSPV